MRSKSGFIYIRCIAFVLLCTQESALHSNDEEDEGAFRFPREQRDIELREVAEGLRIGVQAGASAYRERQSETKVKDSSIDGLDLEFLYELTDRLNTQVLVNYEFDGTKRVFFEEVFAHYDFIEDGPWFIEAGRMEMPFGEYNSNFVEDPLTQVIGETYDGGAVFGYEDDALEVVVAGFKGDFEKANVLASVNFSQNDNLETGIYFSDNIGEAIELRDIQREALLEDEDGELVPNSVPGAGAFVAWNIHPFLIDIEFITALDSFHPGLLEDDRRQPRAANVEIAFNHWKRWQFATRLETSKYLPESPKWQYGVAASYGITENLILTGNYLRAEYREEPSKRNLIQIELIFEF